MGGAVIKVGLVGAAGAIAHRSIVDAIMRQRRLCLSELFDPCLKSGKEESGRLSMTHSASLDGVLRRSAGIVVADVGWMGVEPLILAAGWQRPVLVLPSVLARLTFQELNRLRHFAVLTRTLVMPALLHRWAPATLRLRELTATQLGMIDQLTVECRAADPSGDDRLLTIDWCCSVMQSEPCRIATLPDQQSWRLTFRRRSKTGEPVQALIRFQPGEPAAFPVLAAEALCRQGAIRIAGEQSLEWSTGGSVEQETLGTDRASEDVMVDLFGRRLAGGIVPVPDIDDVVKAHQICEAASRAAEKGDEVPFIRDQNGGDSAGTEPSDS